jgi:uncharacterized OsmC-like protein
MSRRRISAVPPPAPVGGNDLGALIVQVKAGPGATRTLKCRTVAHGRLSQLNYIRSLPARTVMEHEPDGLSDETIANASETLLAAFGSCLAVGIHANAVVNEIPIRSLELELEADMDTTSLWRAGGLAPKAIGFETIRVVVHLDADVPRQALDALIHHALLWSPVANTLHNPVHLDVTLAPD